MTSHARSASGQPADAAAFYSTLTSCSPSWKYYVILDIRLRLHYLKNTNPAKFHPDPIWNDGASCFFDEHRPNNKKKTPRWVAVWDQFL